MKTVLTLILLLIGISEVYAHSCPTGQVERWRWSLTSGQNSGVVGTSGYIYSTGQEAQASLMAGWTCGTWNEPPVTQMTETYTGGVGGHGGSITMQCRSSNGAVRVAGAYNITHICVEPEPVPECEQNGGDRVDLPSSVTAEQVVNATEICVEHCKVMPVNEGLVIAPNGPKYGIGASGFVHYGVVLGPTGQAGTNCAPSDTSQTPAPNEDGYRCAEAKSSAGATVAKGCTNNADKNKLSDGKDFNGQWSKVDADGWWNSNENCVQLSSGGVMCKESAPPEDRPKDEDGDSTTHDANIQTKGPYGTGCTTNCNNATSNYHYYGPTTVNGGCGGTGQLPCGGGPGGECDPETQSCGGEGEGDCDPATEDCGQCVDDPGTEQNECGTGSEFTAPSVAYQYSDASQLVTAKRAEIAQFIQTTRGEASQLLSPLDGVGAFAAELPCWETEVFGKSISFCPREFSQELAVLGQMMLLMAALMAAFILLR